MADTDPKEIRHGEVPVAQALPRRPGAIPQGCVPMDQWTPRGDQRPHRVHGPRRRRARASAASSSTPRRCRPEGTFVRFDGEGKPPVTDGPFAETKDLIAGWMVIDVDSLERAHEAAAFLSSAPGPGGEPIQEWIEVRPFLRAARRRHRVTVDAAGPTSSWRSARSSASSSAAEPTSRRPRTPSRRPWSRRYAAGPTTRRTTQGLAGDGRVAQVHRRAALRGGPPTARGAASTRSPTPGPTEQADDTLLLLFLCCHPSLTPGVGGRADPAGGRRAHHRADRRGLPGARGDDGAADQPRQAHRRRRAARRRPATCGRVLQGALPDLQRGLRRRGRPGRRGDPADPAAGAAPATSPRSPGCSR